MPIDHEVQIPEQASSGPADLRGLYRRRPEPEFVRFTRLQRTLHACMIVSFLSLATTGLTLKFSYTKWAAMVSRFLGGFQVAGFIHRTAALLMFGVFITHLYSP